jgi:hypothetical protein
MLKPLLTVLLIINMAVGLFIWLQDHDNNNLRVKQLGSVLLLALVLLLTLILVD